MSNKWDSQIRKGILDFVILLYLQNKEYYGYELIRDIKKSADIELSEGTIYPLLNRLKKEELISSNWITADSGIPRKYYCITSEGREALKQMKKSWIQLTDSIDDLMVKK